MRAILLLSLLLLAGCGDDPPPTAEVLAARKPADARLAGLYQTSCKACHAVLESGAPPVGVKAKWTERVAKGDAVLLQHTLEGFNGMPAGGQCFSCTPADYAALIRFLSGREGS